MTKHLLDVQYTTQLSIPTPNALVHGTNEPNQGCNSDEKARNGWSPVGRSRLGCSRAKTLWTKVSDKGEYLHMVVILC